MDSQVPNAKRLQTHVQEKKKNVLQNKYYKSSYTKWNELRSFHF